MRLAVWPITSHEHGWREGEAVAMRANISSDPAEDSLNKLHRPKATLAELNSHGL